MIYNANKPDDVELAQKRFAMLIAGKKRFDLTEKKGGKTRSQNCYLHLILGWFALEYGDTLEYVKQEIFKKIVNRDIFKTVFVNHRSGELREAWKSWGDVDKDEARMAIERFRNWSSAVAGIYLPEANEKAILDSIEEQLSKYNNRVFVQI